MELRASPVEKRGYGVHGLEGLLVEVVTNYDWFAANYLVNKKLQFSDKWNSSSMGEKTVIT